MKDEEKVGEKKMKTAKKMFRSDEECEKCRGKHKSGSCEYTEQKFSKKDRKNEKKDLKEKSSAGYEN